MMAANKNPVPGGQGPWSPVLIAGVMPLMLAAGLSGCVGQAPAAVSTACGWDKIIHPSPADTNETLRQVDEHNKALRANCAELAVR